MGRRFCSGFFWSSLTFVPPETRAVSELKPAKMDMGAAVRVSPLIKTARWSLLLLGIYWGNKRFQQLKVKEDELRAYEAKMNPFGTQKRRPLRPRQTENN